ncbi:MAG: hypothetical protein NT070_11540 [Cyanobacteria bacterium]|nr:hypothetical protein [Cyanobacteriota bacterium]
MTHTFLLEAGTWNLQGTWLDKESMPVPVKGRIIIQWGRDGWFNMVTRLVFVDSDREKIEFQYRGRFDTGNQRYTYVLQHTELGRVEGEGWIAPESIIQRYWALGDRQRRSGFETLYRVADDRYHFSSGIMAGHYLTSTLEAIIERA